MDFCRRYCSFSEVIDGLDVIMVLERATGLEEEDEEDDGGGGRGGGGSGLEDGGGGGSGLDLAAG